MKGSTMHIRASVAKVAKTTLWWGSTMARTSKCRQSGKNYTMVGMGKYRQVKTMMHTLHRHQG